MEMNVIDAHVYEDSVRYAGMVRATLPELNARTQTVSGAGIAGEIETVTPGHYSAMTLTLNFLVTTAETIKLSEPRKHTLDLRVAIQGEDPVSGSLPTTGERHVMVVIPKKAGGGSVAPASPMDVSLDFAVHYWAIYVNNVKVQEIDPINNICFMNGKDYLAEVRSALGM